MTSDARYKIITGGRGSGKSYSTATLILLESDNDDGTILYTRFTLKNAEQSIFPEFEDKIDELGWRGKFHKSGNDYINLESGAKILFRGIKTSDGINTAALKSIPKLKMWVNDESEELVDENIFNTIDLSIRDAKYKLQIWLILNPSDINHFIYRKFFKNLYHCVLHSKTQHSTCSVYGNISTG
jgi:phage terminase large subunit